MLEPWALKHKGLKKKVAWWLYQRRDLKRRIATSQLRRRSPKPATARFWSSYCHRSEWRRCAGGRGLQASFVSLQKQVGRDEKERRFSSGRIYPIKGLPMFIEAWARVKPDGWLLRIAGPDEAGHRKQVESAVSAAGLGEVVSFTGPVEPQIKKSVFLDADLFVLPTHSESFGMVVAEALAHSVPVLTTTAAPWSILRERGCGWSVDPTIDGIADGLRQATGLETEALGEMGRKGRALVIEKFSWRRIADLMLSTYEKVLEARDRREAAPAALFRTMNKKSGG